jgi:transposase
VEDMEELSREELVAENAGLRAENAELRALVEELRAEVDMLRSQLSGKTGGSGAAPFIKPNRKDRREQERAERKKRSQSFARRLDIPTEEVRHAVEICPDCGRKLTGGWEHSSRQTIEMPDTPVRIIKHVLLARRCGVCGKNYVPKLGPSDEVIGNMRIGPRLMSFIAMLAIAGRMPQRAIMKLLESLYWVHISVGEISEVLHRVAELATPEAESILREIRGSPYANGDETGWREDGINGYLWSLSTPLARFFYFAKSRASWVVERILGYCFCGVLVCDFYKAYNWYSGPIQRCWVHFLRDLAKLLEKNPENASLTLWVEEVKHLYKAAKKVAKRSFREDVRIRLRQELETKIYALAEPYIKNEEAPQRVLAERIDKHLDELFTFVQYPGCPSGNNAAERAIRPAVIARKISGGTRSEKGSQTRTTLMSVFGTWQLQGRDLLATCTNLLTSGQSPAENSHV